METLDYYYLLLLATLTSKERDFLLINYYYFTILQSMSIFVKHSFTLGRLYLVSF